MKKLETRSWWPDLVALKDDMSLRELSEKFGAAPAAISNALKRNGLSRKSPAGSARKPRDKKTPRKPSRRAGTSILAQYKDQMGKVVDRVIAEKAGVTVSAVTNYRKRHNIKASGSRGRPRARPEGGNAIRRRHGVAQGYRVTIGGEPYVVIAKDIAEAATIAGGSGRGVVTQIELLGRALSK